MDDNAFVNLLAIETATPKWRITRSAGAIYIALIVTVIGCISIGNLLYKHWMVPRLASQMILYAMVSICAFYLYRRHFICYRYTLTDEAFAIEQIGGNNEKTIAAILLSEILDISLPGEKADRSSKRIDASLPPKKDVIWILVRQQEKEAIFSIRASTEFVATLRHATGLTMSHNGKTNT